ncbi:MAG TPA: hypothetical protein VEW69_11830, partial [Alphaproteobacteria bacterium]|nr:hypothetical protein [Alphaproteobacteria bacterium]
MVEKNQIKTLGLRFARSLQMIVKMVNMFSAEHKSASGLMQRSYDQLNSLVKQTRHITIGFVDNRVLINNILTADDSLKPLEKELLRRGIGAVTFEAGITLAGYKMAIASIAANPKLIEESGGLMPFLEQRQLEFVRVFPANKNDIRNDDGDTVLEVGSEEYLISKALSGMNSGYSTGGIDSLLAHMDPSVGISAGDGGGGTGSGLGGGGVFGAGDGGGSGPGGGPGSGGVGGGP